jgi:hypothetical protein
MTLCFCSGIPTKWAIRAHALNPNLQILASNLVFSCSVHDSNRRICARGRDGNGGLSAVPIPWIFSSGPAVPRSAWKEEAADSKGMKGQRDRKISSHLVKEFGDAVRTDSRMEARTTRRRGRHAVIGMFSNDFL